MKAWARNPKSGWALLGLLVLGTAAGQPGFCASEILRADPDGANVEVILPREAALAYNDIAFDPEQGALPMYWGMVDPFEPYGLVPAFRIRRAGPYGYGIEQVSIGSGPIAFDPVNDKMFFVGRSDCVPCDAIFRADLDGSNRETILYEVYVQGLAVDPVGGKIYWSQEAYSGEPGLMWSANLDGTEPQALFDLSVASSIAVDVQARRLYWAEFAGSIRRSNLDGSAIEDLVTDLDYPSGLTIDPEGDRMWWTERNLGTIGRARLDGSDVTQVVAGLERPVGIAYFPSGGPNDGKIYFIANPGPVDQPVPAISSSGVFVLILVLLSVSTLILMRRP